MANTHARCGAASHIAPRHFILPHNRKKRANAKFNTKNTHEIPATAAASHIIPRIWGNLMKVEIK